MVDVRTASFEETNKALARKRTRSKIGKILAMAFIYFVLVLMYAPLLYITVFSFTDAGTTGVWSGFSLETYKTLFNPFEYPKVEELWIAVGNTILVAVVSGLLSTLLGTLGAIGIYYSRKKWFKNSLEFINQIPVVNAEIVTAVSLCILFVFFTKTFGIERNFFSLVIGHIVLTIPYVVMSVEPKLEQMDPSLYEAAMDLGATQTQALMKIVIPDIFPGILSGFMLAITLSLDDYVITAFTRPGSFATISTFVDEKMKRGGLPIQLRSFTAIIFVIILIVMIVINVRSAVNARKIEKKEKGVN